MWVLIKTAKAGRLIYEKTFEDLESVRVFLKTTDKVVEQIVAKERFPKGKTCVFNKYVLREKKPEVPDLRDRFEVRFD